MRVEVAVEFNDKGYLVHFVGFPGAFVRGRTLEDAISKVQEEIASYLRWLEQEAAFESVEVIVIQEKESVLEIQDGDTDIIIESETKPLSLSEYLELKRLALKSAQNFQTLFDSIPEKTIPLVPERRTFYGYVPRSALEMYEHTKNVNSYYFGEIGIEVGNGPDIFFCRAEGFQKLEGMPNYLENKVVEGSYGEFWSLKKVLRRFIWHDRIHAKAMYRSGVKAFGREKIKNPFYFGF